MKVALLTSHYPPPFNANAVRAYHFVRVLRERRHEVLVVPLVYTRAREGHFGERVVFFENVISRGQGERFVRPPLYRRALDLFVKHFRLVGRYGEVVREFGPDVVVATVPAVEAPMIAEKIMRKFSIDSRLVVDMQDLVDDYRVLERPWLAPLIKLYLSGVYRVSRRADAVFAPTEFMAETLRERLGHDRIYVVPNGVDAGEYLECYRRRLSRPAGEGVVRAFFLGDLNYRYHFRGLVAFIDALRVVNRGGVRVVLEVVGSGRFLDPLRGVVRSRGAKGFVRIHGFLPRERVFEVMSSSDFAVIGREDVPNRWILDTIRLTTYEYLACGLPLLGFGPRGSYTEYFIREHRVGVYVASNRAEELAAGVEELLGLLRSEGRGLVERCRRVAESYDWGRIMSRAVDVLEALVGGRGG